MAGHSRSKNGVASLAYVPAIQVFRLSKQNKTWMAGYRFSHDDESRVVARC